MPDKTPGSTNRTSSSRLRKATTIVPIALLSAAWTASLTGVGVVNTASDAPSFPAVLPGGGSVPAQAIEAPASVSTPAQGSPTLTGGNAEAIVANSSSNEIPAAALAAYQRAETVIDQADASCHLTWQLLAAIGRVESDHGRSHGSALGDDGIARPAIYGVRLKLADTDAGLIDGAAGYDRAVGPMQFIPSTWQAVAVDADNDGSRNPQDINDAALGAAVYLCSGAGDLSTTTGQRSAVYRYNHSSSYVDLVLAIMDSYLNGDFMASPNGTIAGGYLAPLPAAQQPHAAHHPAQHPAQHPSSTGTAATNPAPASAQPTSQPSASGGGGGTGSSGNGSGSGSKGGGPGSGPSLPGAPDLPVPTVPVPTVKVPQVPQTGVTPADDVLTTVQAIAQCTLDGDINDPADNNDAFDQCLVAYTTTGKPPVTQP